MNLLLNFIIIFFLFGCGAKFEVANTNLNLIESKNENLSCISPSSFSVNIIDNSGEIDSTFGSNGFVEYTEDISEVLDKKIISWENIIYDISVEEELNVFSRLVIRKYFIDGEIDSCFGDNGVFKFDNFSSDITKRVNISKVQIDTSGYLYVAGQVTDENFNYRGYILKINQEGDLDNEFGVNGCGDGSSGCLIVDDSSFLFNSEKVVDFFIYQENILALYQYGSNSTSFDVRSYDKRTGEIDDTFASGSGTFEGVTEVGASFIAESIYFDSLNNFIYVSGNKLVGNDKQVFIQRITSLGVLDNSYGISSVAMIPFPTDEPGLDYTFQIKSTLTNNGELWMLGYGVTGFVLTNMYIFKVNLNSGTLISSFDNDGYKDVSNLAPLDSVGSDSFYDFQYDDLNSRLFLLAKLYFNSNSFKSQIIISLDNDVNLDTSWQDVGFYYVDSTKENGGGSLYFTSDGRVLFNGVLDLENQTSTIYRFVR